MLSKEEITILFEEPFWIALIERYTEELYSVARVVIGTSEPQGVQLIDFLNHLDYDKLLFTRQTETERKQTKKISFKKQMNKTKQQQENKSKYTYTKAQSLLKLQQSELKTERKKNSRIEKEIEMQQKFEIKQLKRKKKHRGH